MKQKKYFTIPRNWSSILLLIFLDIQFHLHRANLLISKLQGKAPFIGDKIGYWVFLIASFALACALLFFSVKDAIFNRKEKTPIGG